MHARGLGRSHGPEARALLARVSLIDFSPAVLARALEPFPTSVGTLDGLHLATIEFLRAGGEDIELASYDQWMNTCAQALGIAIYAL
jgi:hypothetical protein